MSRQVDLTKPLSAEDVAELTKWGNPLPDGVTLEEGTKDPAKVDDTKPPAEDDEPSDDYDAWKVGELRDALKELDLPTEGNKAELIARLREADAKGL